MWYVHKYEVAQQYGGPEEGGWWFQVGSPVEGFRLAYTVEETAYEACRALNGGERERAKRDEEYEYTSVLSYKSQHFSYDVSEKAYAEAYPKSRPHYE